MHSSTFIVEGKLMGQLIVFIKFSVGMGGYLSFYHHNSDHLSGPNDQQFIILTKSLFFNTLKLI